MDDTDVPNLSRRRFLAGGAAAAGAMLLPSGLLVPGAAFAAGPAGDLDKTDPSYRTRYLQTLHPFNSALAGSTRVSDSLLRNPRFKSWPTKSVRIVENADPAKNSGTVFLGPWRGAAHHGGSARGLQSAVASPLAGSCLNLEIRRPGTFYVRQYVPLGGAYTTLRAFSGKEFTLSADVELSEVNLYRKGAPQTIGLGAYVSYKFARTVGKDQNRQFILNTANALSEPATRTSTTDPHLNRYFLQSTFFTRPLPSKLPAPDAMTGLEVALLINIPQDVSRVVLAVRQLRLSRARNFNAVDTSS
jgi:hypothetical protein